MVAELFPSISDTEDDDGVEFGWSVNRGYYSNTDGVIEGRIGSGFVKDIESR